MIERDLVAEFNIIVEQYKTSPFGFRLRKTGNILKFAEYNGLYYVDVINLYKIINELLGPNIPEEIIEYLKKITFSELITFDTPRGTESRTMTCIQFIDDVFFEKCSNWISQKSEKNTEEYGMLFNSLFTSNDPLSTLNFKQTTYSEMIPFQGKSSEKQSKYDGKERRGFNPKFGSSSNFNSNQTTPFSSNHSEAASGSRPRGKQMSMSSENIKDRPFICEVPFCDRAFKRYEHLKRHSKMHTGDRPFKCDHPACFKSFSRSDNLNQHLKTHRSESGNEGNIRFTNDTSDLAHE